jgi:hypothetical protein
MEVSREVLSVRKSMDQFTDMKKRLDLVNSALEKNVTLENFDAQISRLEEFVKFEDFAELKNDLMAKADNEDMDKKLL